MAGAPSSRIAELTGAGMSSINDTGAGSLGIRARIEGAAWIRSASFDFFLLICAPLVTLPILVGIYWKIPFLAIGCAFALAVSHYASTLVFYFWDDNREYYRSRWLAFFAGPVILAVVYGLVLGFEIPYLVQVVLFGWNTWHVSRQNCGILSIYRSRAGVSNVEQKKAANNAIVAISAFLALWNINTHYEVMGFFGWFSKDLYWIIKIVFGATAAFFMVKLGIALLRRKEQLGLAEGLFLTASLGFFYPYLFIKDSTIATVAMLLPHYVQYLTLVWLLHRRKFGTATEGAPAVLRNISSKLVFLIPVLIATGLPIYWVWGYMVSIGQEWWFGTVYMLVAFEHYYLDGLIWSFRRPHVRQTMLPFLLRHPGRALS
jgi:hypothetical protein